jgi:hypothetical protein
MIPFPLLQHPSNPSATIITITKNLAPTDAAAFQQPSKSHQLWLTHTTVPITTSTITVTSNHTTINPTTITTNRQCRS